MSGNPSPLHTTSFGEPDSPWCSFQAASGLVSPTFAQRAVDMTLHAVPAAMVINGAATLLQGSGTPARLFGQTPP